ncbi:2'-5' RNA ligase family protein [Gelidibacter salicanalis]|uniref:2'-5' RNA ligase family protein n=1 Tax=Gelidibacter salicanalis TaxID=291193 RepID=A0A934KRJ0_9FLAO|nr:2'-5' RNA ligase family protein [Gelidibacter salicanalis]MBJ7882499.1 2'-5' RNA ligase family protein [Gelidibacter salicanalis]
MKRNFLIAFLLILALTHSCGENQDKIIAIDVLLTLPEDVYDQAVHLNQSVLKNNPNNFTLDDQHIPHITLLQSYVKESDLPEIETLLVGLYKTIADETFVVDQLQYAKDKNKSFASMGMEKSEALMALHEKVIGLLKPYSVSNGSQVSYVQNEDGTPIDDFTIAYVPKFVSDYSFINFNPHISLGVGETTVLDSLAQHHQPTKFKAPALALYQLGNFGTARKLLWESK